MQVAPGPSCLCRWRRIRPDTPSKPRPKTAPPLPRHTQTMTNTNSAFSRATQFSFLCRKQNSAFLVFYEIRGGYESLVGAIGFCFVPMKRKRVTGDAVRSGKAGRSDALRGSCRNGPPISMHASDGKPDVKREPHNIRRVQLPDD